MQSLSSAVVQFIGTNLSRVPEYGRCYFAKPVYSPRTNLNLESGEIVGLFLEPDSLGIIQPVDDCPGLFRPDLAIESIVSYAEALG